MTESEKKLEAMIAAIEGVLMHGMKSNGRTPISCELIIEELYDLRRSLHEDLHG